MNRLTGTSFLLTVFLGPLTSLSGGEVCVCPPMVVSQPVVTTVYRPLRVAPGVILPEVRQVSDLVVSERVVVRKPAVPKSAPAVDEEAEMVADPIPPPPIPLFDPIEPVIIRGQVSGSSSHLLDERPPPPMGPIDNPSVIPDGLRSDAKTAESVVPAEPAAQADDPAKASGPSTNGMLLLVTLCALGFLFYFIAIALDYRQRWMQSLTSQNNRLSLAVDDPMPGWTYSDDGDLYGGGFRRFGADPMEF